MKKLMIAAIGMMVACPVMANGILPETLILPPFLDFRQHAHGIQAGLWSVSGGTDGVQLAVLWGISDMVNGVQMGFITSATSLNGVQIGFCNAIYGELNGLQIGFINEVSGASDDMGVFCQVGLLNSVHVRGVDGQVLPFLRVRW